MSNDSLDCSAKTTNAKDKWAVSDVLERNEAVENRGINELPDSAEHRDRWMYRWELIV